jgi:hypothetical protein
MPRQLPRLIEAAHALARSMERHGHDQVCPRHDLRAGHAHARRQVPRERGTAVVLQGMDDRAKRPLIRSDRSRERHERLFAPAARAQRLGDADDAPRRQRIATGAAARWSNWNDGRPAEGTDGAARGVIERTTAGRAERCEQDRHRAVGERPQQAFSRRAEGPRPTPRCAPHHPTGARGSRTPASAA